MSASTYGSPTCEPNVTPMLDVLLVLLIVFLSVVIQVHRSIDVNLPQTCSGACAGGVQIVLEIRPGPTYRINSVDVPRRRLADYIRMIYDPRPDKTLQIAGYPGVRYDDVVAAMDVAKSAGVLVVGIAPKESYLRR
jgi:biopolymer transport protein TolR